MHLLVFLQAERFSPFKVTVALIDLLCFAPHVFFPNNIFDF